VLTKEEQMTPEAVVIREGEKIIWQKGQFVPGVQGHNGDHGRKREYTIQSDQGHTV